MYTIEREWDRGQVGIGTLIVFIAMVLVAAIAAGVLVDTADMLQESAEQTGEESQAQVSDRIQVIDVYGEVDLMTKMDADGSGMTSDPVPANNNQSAAAAPGEYSADAWEYTEGLQGTYTDGTSIVYGYDADGDGTADPVVHEIGFVMKRAAGANDINLETVTVSWIGPDGPEQMTLDPSDNAVTIDDTVAGSDNNLLDSEGDRAKVTLRLGRTSDGSSSFESTNLRFLAEGEEVTVKFNTEAGATVTKRINVPTLLQDDDTIVL